MPFPVAMIPLRACYDITVPFLITPDVKDTWTHSIVTSLFSGTQQQLTYCIPQPMEASEPLDCLVLRKVKRSTSSLELAQGRTEFLNSERQDTHFFT